MPLCKAHRTLSTHILSAIGIVECPRTEPLDDDWGDVTSTIRLDAERFGAEVLAGLSDFSHIDVVFVFDQVDESKVNLRAHTLEIEKTGHSSESSHSVPRGVRIVSV